MSAAGGMFRERLGVEVAEAIASRWAVEDDEEPGQRTAMVTAVLDVVWPRLARAAEELIMLARDRDRLLEQRKSGANLHVALALALGRPTMSTDVQLIDRVRSLVADEVSS